MVPGTRPTSRIVRCSPPAPSESEARCEERGESGDGAEDVIVGGDGDGSGDGSGDGDGDGDGNANTLHLLS